MCMTTQNMFCEDNTKYVLRSNTKYVRENTIFVHCDKTNTICAVTTQNMLCDNTKYVCDDTNHLL